MGRRIRNLSAILLKCALVSYAASGQQAALGAGMAAPPRLADWVDKKPAMMVASAAQAGDNGMVAAQETKNADVPAEPQASVLEHKSTTPLPSRKLRRRKPRMAGVPAGPQAVAQVTKEPAPQAVAQETEKTAVPKTDTPVKPQAVAQVTKEPAPQAVAQEDEEADSFASAKPQVAAQEKTKLAADGGKRYRMAPIQWGARVSETLGWLSNSSTEAGSDTSLRSRTLSNVQTAEIKLSSYIMQPYIAQVSGGIGVVRSADRTSGAGSTGSAGSTNGVGRTNGVGNSLYGNGALSLFSRSRFPFNMTFAATDSRTNSELTNDYITHKDLNLNQSYRPPTGYSSYMGRYNRSASNSILRGNSVISSLDGDYSTRLGSDHDQPFNAHAQVNTNSLNGSNLSANIFRAQHTYLPKDSLLSLTTNASLTTTSQQDQAQPANKAQFLQANAVAGWQPESEDIPLFVSGSGQLFRALTTSGGVTTTAQSLGGTVAANYLASHNLTYNAGGSVTYGGSGANLSLTTVQRGGAYYRSNPLKLGTATYSWTTNGVATNQTGTAPNSSVAGSVGHSLNGPYALNLFSRKSMLRYGVNQSLTVGSDRIDGPRETLANSGTLAWTGPQSEALSSGASVSVSDSRTFGKKPAHTQIIVMDLNGLSRYRTSVYGLTVDANATLVVMRDPQGKMQATPVGRGAVAYSKQSVFGVRGLYYDAKLDMSVTSNRNSNQNLPGSVAQKPVSYALTQRLIYRIGQNELRLAGSLADQNGVKNALLLLQFRAWRTVGN